MKHKKIYTLPSPQDLRDYKAEGFIDLSPELPASYVAPRTWVRCQWLSSQCVAFACTQAMSQQEVQNEGSYNIYSTGYLYGNREDVDYQLDGWYIRQCLKNLQKYGTVLKQDFPGLHSYKTEKRRIERDKENLAQKASEHKIKTYFRCYSEDEVKRCIMQYGCVITSCIIRGDDWMIRKYIPEEQRQKENMGGHAFILIGWTEDGRWIAQDSYSILRPSWGKFQIDMKYPLAEFWGIIL